MRANYGYESAGSLGPYQDAGMETGSESLYSMTDRARSVYNGVKNQLRHQVIEKPYKGWSNIFGALAGIGTFLTAGLLAPALFTGAVAWGVTRSIGYGADRAYAGIRSGMKPSAAAK
ncbi:MAG: hypothetical protein HYT70_00675 [Candidatus Aenigmarchaeota archaeon]|nr:hypothetical protein [Candidatus Aenigmarchaeota archaeon]